MAAVIVDNTDGGFSTVGSWSTSSGGTFYGADKRFIASGSGSNTASWNVTGLSASTPYLVAICWDGNANRGSNVPWTVYDSNGTSVLASGTVSQIPSSVGQTSGGIQFQYLTNATVSLSGTSLTVKITDNANGFVIADAVLVQLATDLITFSSVQDGNWSATSTWRPTLRTPTDGDVVLYGHNVTVDASVTTGSDATNAITSNSATSKTLTINTGVNLKLKGSISNPASTYFVVVMNAGSTLTFLPASGITPTWSMQSVSTLTCNGTSGSHCVVTTDKSRGGNNAYMDVNTHHIGLQTATYTDFSHLGSSSNSGVTTSLLNADAVSVSVTNCTFTDCNYLLTTGSTWDLNFTFNNNTFTTSVLITLSGIANCCAGFPFGGNRSTGVRQIDSCSFDAGLFNGAFRQCTFSNNYVASFVYTGSGSSWPSSTYCFNNFISGNTETILTLYGNIKDCYFYNTAANNPHYVGIDATVTAGTVIGLIFESSGTGGTGDCIFPPTIASGSPTLSVTNCLVLPDSGGRTSGKLISDLQTSKIAITVEHNTYEATLGEHALIGLDETASSYAAEIASCRANLIWSASATTGVLAISSAGSGTPAVDTVTLAGYNGFWNPNTGTCFYNTSTSQAGVVGYSGIKVSVNHTYPNTAVGTGDISANPSFVDSTRALATWGGTAAGGGVATAAGALATLAANPALIGQATTGLLAWVRAGFQPTNISYQAASYGGDASTTDAAGNSWPGGAPGIGAMAYLTCGLPAFYPDGSSVERAVRRLQTPGNTYPWYE